MIETRGAAAWICSVLGADGSVLGLLSGSVWIDRVPQGTVPPYGLVQYAGGHDVMVLGTARVMADASFLVRAVGYAEDASDLKLAADRIDLLLQGQVGSASGVSILACVREAPFERAYSDRGMEFLEMGGRYRLILQGS